MRTAFALVLALLVAVPAIAVFEDLTPWTRARGLAGTYVALSDDGGAVFGNPAGLARFGGYSFYTGYQQPFGQSYLKNYVAEASASFGKYGSLALGLSRLGVDYEGVEMTTESFITLGYGYTLASDITSSLHAGVAAHVYQLDYAESVGGVDLGGATTLGVSFGVLGVLWERTRVGATFVNLNGPKLGEMYKADLPQRIRFGLAYEPYEGATTSAEVDKRWGGEASVRVGVEATLYDMFLLRGGAQTKPNLQSLGAGLRWRNVGFDYAITFHPVLPATHEFGVSYRFGAQP